MTLVPEPIFSFATELARIWIRGSRFSRVAIALATVLALTAGAMVVLFPHDRLIKVLAAAAAVCALAALSYERALERSERAERITEIEREVEAHPNKAKPAWDLASAKLEEYVARNLSHVAWIFFLVLAVMTMGFIIIGWGVYKVFSTEEIGPSVVAAASGIVVEFIAATFLLIYRSTMEQAMGYVAMLERINAVGMSAQLLESIEDPDPKARDEAKANLASALLKMYSLSQYEAKP